jgi:hypothetical protein
MICRSFVVALLMGLIALPAAAAPPGTAGEAEGAGAHPQAASQVGMRDGATADPEGTYSWDKNGNVQPSTDPLPDERSSANETIVRIAQAALMIGLIVLGLAITFKSLFSDMKRRRRVAYRPRGR